MKRTMATPMQKSISLIVHAAGLANEFEEARRTGQPFHLSITNPPYMRLVIEVVGAGEVSVAHYYQQNGDAMRDPEIVFDANWLPIEITQDPMGVYRRARPGFYLSGVTGLARMWASNLRAQHFTRGTFESHTHTIQAAPLKLAA